jgi:starch phosphorylase
LSGLQNGDDKYIVCSDFSSYCEAQERVDELYRDYKSWTVKAIKGISKSGKFSSDRTIAEYCHYIWDVEPSPVPHPATAPNMRVKSFANLPGNSLPAPIKKQGTKTKKTK